MLSGQFLAIFSAILFGISPALCKSAAGAMSPALLAGLLYLGSGLGLQLHLLAKGTGTVGALRRLPRLQRVKLSGAVLFGGVLAPLCLAYGIKYGFASEVSLLLNLETVATTVVAWVFFKEQVGLRVWGGKVCIVLGAVLIILAGESSLAFSLSGVSVLLACLFWGIDNNLTRDIEELPAEVLASIKGLGAGVFNIMLALVLATGTVSPFQVATTLVIGALSYGLSLVLFVEALRKIGSARTSTYFSIGPFVGVFFSVLFLGEKMLAVYWVASLLMLSGLVFLYRERHSHIHTHEGLAHTHRHLHDEHHGHSHDEASEQEPHEHYHFHAPLTHQHEHLPDIHHRHGHRDRQPAGPESSRPKS
jgi:drug/metabolite transporter (DMT)-like permease